MARRSHALAATTSAVSWTVYEADDFNVSRIDLTLASAPTSAGLITVTKDSVHGAAYDCVLNTVNPVGKTSVSLGHVSGLVNGDKIVVTYANPDGISITGTASLEIYTNISLLESGLTAEGGTIRSLNNKYARYYHIDLQSTDPGASGATWTATDDTNYLDGMLLNSPTDSLVDTVDIHSDWDTSTNPVLEARAVTMVAGSAPGDILKFNFKITYSQPGTAVRTQTFTVERTVDALPQYTQLNLSTEIDRLAASNNILPGDVINIKVNLHADSDITAVLINSASFYYLTTHVGVEAGDV